MKGNRTSAEEFDGLQTVSNTYTYNAANQITESRINDSSLTAYQYDLAGNLTNIGNTLVYTYDTANRLVSFEDREQAMSGSYFYNGLGDRYRQIVDGVQTDYLLDLNTDLTQVLGETTDGVDTHYLLGLDIIAQQQAGEWSYFGYDGLGSTRMMFDPVGTVSYTTSFDPYGMPFEQLGSVGNPSLGFTGEQTDPNGLLYLRARYYNPGIASFLSRDPVLGLVGRSNTFNPYLYTLANPTNYIDPSGKFVWVLAFAAALLGGLTGGVSYGIGSQIIDKLNQGKSIGESIRSLDVVKAGFFGIAGGVIGGTIGLSLLSPLSGAVGAMTNVAGGLISGHNSLQELWVDALIGGAFGGIVGKLGGAIFGTRIFSTSAGSITLHSLDMGFKRLILTSTAFGTLNLAQGATTRLVRNRLFDANEPITAGTLTTDFGMGFFLSLAQFGVMRQIIMMRYPNISTANGLASANTLNRAMQKLSNTLVGFTISGTITSTNLGGPVYTKLLDIFTRSIDPFQHLSEISERFRLNQILMQ